MEKYMDIENIGSREIVVLIDAENAQAEKLKAIMAEIMTHGNIFVKKAYGDWSKANLKNWKEILNFLAIEADQQFSYTTGKNSSDIKMVIEAMDLLYSDKFDTFVLVSSDSDFTSLASRLRASKIYVFGVGEKKTPLAFRNACDNFLFTENLVDLKEQIIPNEKKIENNKDNPFDKEFIEVPFNKLPSSKDLNRMFDRGEIQILEELEEPVENIITLLNKACETYGDEEGWTKAADAGNYIKRSIPGFNVKTYGAQKLSEFIAKNKNLYEIRNYIGKGNVNVYEYRKKQ